MLPQLLFSEERVFFEYPDIVLIFQRILWPSFAEAIVFDDCNVKFAGVPLIFECKKRY